MSRYNSSKFEALVDVALRRLAEDFPDKTEAKFEALVDVALHRLAKDFPAKTEDPKSKVARQNCTRTPKAQKTSSTRTTDLGSAPRLLGQGRQSAPDMSIRELKDLIRDKNGYDLKLIIEKELCHSDVDEGQNQLSMPVNQIFSDDFLSPKEEKILNRSTKKCGSKAEFGIDVGFIGPCREETTMVLKKWSYTNSSSYRLINNWYEIAMKNGLKKGDTVQVTFFRVTNVATDSTKEGCMLLPKPTSKHYQYS